MNREDQLATLTCFGVRPFCALLQSGLCTLIGDSRKHHPNLHTGPLTPAATSLFTALPALHWRCHRIEPTFKTHSPRNGFKSLYPKRLSTALQQTFFVRGASDTALRPLTQNLTSALPISQLSGPRYL